MPVMHFKIVNAKNVKIKFKKPPILAYLFTEISIIGWHTEI